VDAKTYEHVAQLSAGIDLSSRKEIKIFAYAKDIFL
jgi:hypothetical protein